MKYSNVKSGLNKLFFAELLTIAAGFSVAFNGETIQIVGRVLEMLGAAAFIVNLYGLKQCALDEEEYRKPFNLSIAGLVVCLAITILGVVRNDSMFVNSANEVQGVFNYLVAYAVLKTTASILCKCGKETEAAYADKVRKLYTGAFIVGELFGILADVYTGSLLAVVTIITACIAIIALLVAQIRYIFFLKKSANAL